MKYIKIILITLFSLLLPTIAVAAVFQVIQGGTGASTLTGCLEGNGTGAITGTGSACGSGGGSGGGTWSTTTSQVSGQLINYPNNTDDVVSIGANSTTTSEWWYDPNVFIGYIKGKLGIGTTSPSATLHTLTTTGTAGVSLVQSDSSEGGGFRIYDNATSGFIPTFDFSSFGVNGIGGGIIGRIPLANDVLSSSLAALTFDARQGTGASAVTAANTFIFRNGSIPQLVIDAAGDVGIGSTTPFYKLSVEGSSSLGNQAIAGYFTATTSTASTFPLANITKLSNLTGNGFVKTSSSDGTLSVDTTTYESGLTAGDGLTRTVNDFDCDTASGSVFGCLASADWTTFNNKQAAGNYITALTGDVTASGPGSVAATLATVNSNVGSFTNANVTVNAKGLVTAVSNGTAGGGTGTVSTSTGETAGQLPYWTSTNGTPATLGGVATTSVTCTGSATCDPFTVIGASPITINASAGSGVGLATSSAVGINEIPYGTSVDAVGFEPAFTYDPSTNILNTDSLALGDSSTATGTMTLYPADGTAWWHIQNPGGSELVISNGATPGAAEILSLGILNSGISRNNFGTLAPQTLWHIEHSSSSGLDPVRDTNLSGNWPLLLQNLNSTNASSTGIGFTVTNTANNVGAGIAFQRTGGNSQGELQFYTKSSTSGSADPEQRMVINNSGSIGIGTTSPYAKLSVVGETVASHFTATTSTASTFPNASTTNLTVSGYQVNSSLTSALVQTGANGLMAEYAGTQCNDSVITGLSVLGVATCEDVNLDFGAAVTGTLPVGNGGTGASTLTGLLLGNGTSAFTGLTTSAGIFGAISDETGGSGVLVGSAGPTLTGLTTITNSSTTLASFNYASSTNYYGAGLQTCNATTGKLHWANGKFTCETDGGGAGSLDGAGSAGMMASWTDGNTLQATSTIVGATFHATSTATSTFAGNVLIGGNVTIEGDLEVEGGLLPIILATIAAAMAVVSLTYTNKRIQPRTASSTTSATLTPDLSTANVYYRTTQTEALTIGAPTGTPVIGETILIYVDSAGAQTLTMNATYVVFGTAFPAATTAGKTLMISAQYNGTNWKTLWSNAV